MARRVSNVPLDRYDNVAAPGLDDVYQSAAVALEDQLSVNPGLPIIKTPDRPDIQPRLAVRLTRRVIPLPVKGALVHVHEHNGALSGLQHRPLLRDPGLTTFVDRPPLRPCLAVIRARPSSVTPDDHQAAVLDVPRKALHPLADTL